MKRRSRASWLLAALAPTMSFAATPDFIPGLWLQHGEWTLRRGDPDDPDNVFKYADAAVLNFCPDGELRLATGVLNQSTRSSMVVIGASDGLAIYRGRWSRVNGVIRVEYQLVDAEFGDLLRDRVATQRHSTDLGLTRSRITLRFIGVSGTPSTLVFSPAASYEKTVGDDFVTCGKH